MRRDELQLPEPPKTDRPGDRWICGRASDQSPCSRGPGSDGACPLAEKCRPERTWHGRRKQITLVAILALVAATFALTRTPLTATIIKPGELSTPHAQILAGTLTSQRCASCHPQAATAPGLWFSAGTPGHVEVSQSDRCLDCHHTTIRRSNAKLAHNLPLSVRAQIRLASSTPAKKTWHDMLPSAAVDQENVQCSVCHHEHQGAQGDLLAVSDAQCQSCHSDRFGSFADAHPEWDAWPYGRGREIAFDHSSHANKHFPATARGSGVAQFQCSDCHQRTAENELTRSTSYAKACKSCHDESLRIEAADGVDLLALPTLPAESAERIQPWPAAATGFYDGKLSPIAELLMRSDPAIARAVGQLPERDFSRIDRRIPDSVGAGETIANACRQLLQSIGEDGQQVIIDRAESLGMARSTFASFAQSLSPQFLSETHRVWFGSAAPLAESAVRQVEFQTPASRGQADLLAFRPDPLALVEAPSESAELSNSTASSRRSDDDLLADSSSDEDLLGGALPSGDLLDDGAGDLLDRDPLAQDSLDPLSLDSAPTDSGRGQSSDRFNADKMIPAGGWYRDDLRLSVRYRGGGHEDPVLKSMIEMISQLPSGDPARQRLLNTRAVASCVACHPGALSKGAATSASPTSGGGWKSRPLIGRRSEFTKFSHSPHLNVAQLADCSHCHALDTHSGSRQQDLGAKISLTSGIVPHSDFAPLRRQACAVCHTPHAAGEACTTCHRYHIDLR